MAKKKMKKAKKTSRPKPRKSLSKSSSRAQKPAQIEFCQKCGSILVPVKKGKSVYLKCRSCGTEKRRDVKAVKIVEEVVHRKGVTVLEKDITPLPLTEKTCPKCDHPRSYWWLQQTRAADEPPTQFFRCENCKHTWREYK